MGVFLLYLAVAVVASWILYLVTRYPSGFPTHPRFSLPVIGDSLLLFPNIQKGFEQLRKKYGKIHGLMLGNMR